MSKRKEDLNLDFAAFFSVKVEMLDVLLYLWQKPQGFDLINEGSKLCFFVQKGLLVCAKGEGNGSVDVQHEVLDPRCNLAESSKLACEGHDAFQGKVNQANGCQKRWQDMLVSYQL